MSAAEIARESALIEALIELLNAESAWLARESAMPASPFIERRAELLASLEAVSRRRVAESITGETRAPAELEHRAHELYRANRRNLEMVSERLVGLRRTLDRRSRLPVYGSAPAAGSPLAKG